MIKETVTKKAKKDSSTTIMYAIFGIIGMSIISGIVKTAARHLTGTIWYGFLWGSYMGLIMGIAPFIFAKKYNLNRLSLISLLICITSGFLGGLLFAIPAAIIMIIVISKKKPKLVSVGKEDIQEVGDITDQY
jgi:hypothetical protein